MLPQSFHPIIRSWFAETYGQPTSVQAEAWPLIERGEHVLALAPTGSGKTLTAFLSAISRFCAGDDTAYPADKLSVLYVSPLKALNEDIKRNLLEPLTAIRERFEKEELIFPPVHVETRSGDTPQSERRRFLIRPPSILALTPESLAILLLNPKARQVLSDVKYLIIDEIHSVLGNKRGAFLSCQIDRLAEAAGEFQRISLSATVRDPQIAAEFVGALADGRARTVQIVAPPSEKKIEFSVEYPDIENDIDQKATPEIKNELFARIDKFGKRYTVLINYILRRIDEGAHLLVFVESRRRAERLCYFLNSAAGRLAGQTFGGAIAFTHHGSLSKELRRSVEKGLAEGSLPCVVATASLELGIDIGSVDEVVLAGSPANVSQALQRIGRSGHGVGRTSRGKLFAFHGMDLLMGAALKDAVDERDIEKIRPIENPLDILAQIILALCVEKKWNIDELYAHLRGFYTFRNINRDSYNRTVRMLAGLGAKSRLREIKPRIWLDKTLGEIGAIDSTLTLLYSSGGVIANRGMYSLRLADGTKIGELDEEFVYERRLGDCFDFGSRGWRITNIGPESVEAVPLETRVDFIPFWKADAVFRSGNLTERVLAILASYNRTASVDCLEGTAQKSLKAFLDSQKGAQGGIPLTDNKTIVVEITEGTELNREFSRDFCSVLIHSFRGGAVNYPLSLALCQELEETLKVRVETFSNDDSILFFLPRLGVENENTFKLQDLFRRALAALETAGSGGLCRGERLFRDRLETSGVFGANFREAAERSLLLPKAGFGKRTPLWIMRQRSRRLFDAVAAEDGFPAIAEAWRSCLVDIFDIDGFRELLASINNGTVNLLFFHSKTPSPFSGDIVNQEINGLIYETDERKDLAGSSASLSDRVIEEALGSSALRPVLKAGIVNDFTEKLRREKTGWAPENDIALTEWVKERIAIPIDEWEALTGALAEKPDTSGKIKIVKRSGAMIASVVHIEWEETWENEALSLLGPWLRYEGPVSIKRICEVFGVKESAADDAVSALVEIDEAVRDVALGDETGQKDGLVCDRENLDMLLRLSRKKARPVIKEQPASMLVPFLALRQGIVSRTATNAAFRKELYAWTAPAKLWEAEILCARNKSLEPEAIDREIREGRLVWYGTEKEKIGFCSPEDLDLALVGDLRKDAGGMERLLTSGFFDKLRNFWEIKDELTRSENDTDTRTCAEDLWREVWLGGLSADTLEPVRRGIEFGFVPKEINFQLDTESVPFGRRPRVPRALRDRWRSGAPVTGNWFSLLMDGAESPGTPLEEESLNRERVRLLLDRWGILCRPLLEHEAPVFGWSKLLPTIRRMELAGELVAGRFFDGINSLQFASPAIARELEEAEAMREIYWMNAIDPASPCGLSIEGLGYQPCARNAANRLYFRGADLIAISNKNARDIQLFPDHTDPNLPQLINMFKIPRTRKVLSEKNVIIEKINGQVAANSVYAPGFREAGFTTDRGRLCFW